MQSLTEQMAQLEARLGLAKLANVVQGVQQLLSMAAPLGGLSGQGAFICLLATPLASICTSLVLLKIFLHLD